MSVDIGEICLDLCDFIHDELEEDLNKTDNTSPVLPLNEFWTNFKLMFFFFTFIVY